MKKRVKRHAVQQPLDTSYRLIPLTRNQNAIVDVEDFESLSQWNWHAHWNACTKSFVPTRCTSRADSLAMHVQIMGGMCDHINHDTLDNRKKNIRRCTHSENTRNAKIRSDNKAGFKGVCWHKESKKWSAQINRDCKRIYLGLFASKEEAARAYDKAAKEYHGEFAVLNFPNGPQDGNNIDD